jgi:predicted DNA-binding transcriptional regulator YafY
MATNKHATIRYLTLDKCFRNTGRKYYINDLLSACNEALTSHDAKTEGIKRRQLYEDIKFMESADGYDVELFKGKDGKEVYYRYTDPNFSITNKGLNESEAVQIKEALMILTRFKGMPQFEWVEEVIAKFESSFGLKKGAEKIIGFDENLDYTAVKYISPLFNSILYQQAVKILYKSFVQKDQVEVLLHPYYLKQYNNRWFCFGYNEKEKKITNLALDRILDIKEVKLKYRKNETIDFNEYLEEVVGVTVKEVPVQKVVLKVNNELWPYLETKPLHSTQTRINKSEKEFVTIFIKVKPNYELQSLLLSHGEKIEILEPLNLKKEILERVKKIK